MASSSSSSGVGKISKGPQVFINFRGEELRKSFMAYLEPALREANINVFIDEHEMLGTNLQNLLVRIEESRVALAIFSKEYTTSVRCLDELVKIKECMNRGSLIGIPIFYKLETSVVSNLEGKFGDNFRLLKRSNQHDPVKTQKWEDALTSITQTKGMRLPEQSDRSDKEFIDKIVEEVKRLLANISMVENVDRRGQDANRQCVMIYARQMEFTHSENPKIWTWSSIYDASNEAVIEVATLNAVYSLHISGKYHTRSLTPGKKYEVVFVVKLDDTSSGWEEPVSLSLELVMPYSRETLQERTLNLGDYRRNNWLELQAGYFVALPKAAPAEITFNMYQYVDVDRKTGLTVKGVSIRPVD